MASVGIIVACGLLSVSADAGQEAMSDQASMEQEATVASFYHQGRYAEATTMTEALLRQTAQRFGPWHVQVAKHQNNLARLYALQHHYEEAALLYQRSLEIVEAQLGLSHPQVATVLEGYAELLKMSGDTTQAEVLLARATTIRVDDAAQIQQLTQHATQGEAHYQQGRFAEAEKAALEEIRMAEQRFGSNHPRVGLALNDLATSYYAQKKYKEAEPLYKRALAILERTVGFQHPDTVTILQNYALSLRESGRTKEAQALEARVRGNQ